MTRLFLLPGDLICDAFGLRGESDHRQILRSFFNMMIWGGISIAVALKATATGVVWAPAVMVRSVTSAPVRPRLPPTESAPPTVSADVPLL